MSKAIQLVVYGNGGSGKTTLAKSCVERDGLAHLDLDTIAWARPGVRQCQKTSEKLLRKFMSQHDHWVVEGCYSSLISIAAESANHLVFLNLGIESCMQNCKSRGWEQQKYESKEQQDEQLQNLLDWVARYESRTGEFSLIEHQAIFEVFEGDKAEIKSKSDAENWVTH